MKRQGLFRKAPTGAMEDLFKWNILNNSPGYTSRTHKRKFKRLAAKASRRYIQHLSNQETKDAIA